MSATIGGLSDLLPQLVDLRAGPLPGVVAEHEPRGRLVLRCKRHEPSMTVIEVPEPGRIALADLAEEAGSSLPASADPAARLSGGASLETAEPWHVAYMDHARYGEALRSTRAGACFVAQDPHFAYAKLLARLHPEALRPGPVLGRVDVGAGCFVHPTARIEIRVVFDPGVVIGERVIVGAGTTLGAHVVLGPDVVIGRDCSIGAGVTIAQCDMGDRVIIHVGARIGQDGFGFALGVSGHLKVPQLGRVLIGDDVEIGANSTVDRGSGRDTVIGNGTKIDNLVQIAHNVRIGRHCVIAAQAGIAGSTVLEDGVAVGGQSAIAGHLHIGRGAQLAGASGFMRSIPAGERWGGMPARPAREWLRETITLRNRTKHPSGT